jgi:hypothetical protein
MVILTLRLRYISRRVTSICFLPLISGVMLLFSPSSFAQPIIWQPEQRLSFDTYNSGSPRVFAQGETIHVFWGRSLSGEKLYIRSTDAGLAWSSPVSIYSDRVGNSGSTSNIVMAGRNIYILFQTCDTCQGNPYNYWVTLRRSTDAGESFEPYRLLFPGSPGSPGSVTAIDSLVVFKYALPNDPNAYLNVSPNYGETWQSVPLQFRNFQRLRLINHRLHITQPATGVSRAEVSYSFSDDLGGSWNLEVMLSTVDIYPSDQHQMDGTNNSNIFVVWNDGKYGTTNGFVGSTIARRSVDSSRSWQPEMLLTALPSAGSPRIAVESQFVGVVWHNESQPFLGVSLSLSTNVGMTWLPHIAVSDSSIQTLYPDIDIDNDRVYVVWAKRLPSMPDQIYFRSGRIITTSVPISSELPEQVQLHPNYPNPFNVSTNVSYSLPIHQHISLSVFDVLGREVATLVDETKLPGEYSATFDGSQFSSGVYFCRLATSDFVLTKKLILLK